VQERNEAVEMRLTWLKREDWKVWERDVVDVAERRARRMIPG
jgi:hypothetical protein